MPSTDESIKQLEQRVTDAKNELLAAEGKAKEAKTASEAAKTDPAKQDAVKVANKNFEAKQKEL